MDTIQRVNLRPTRTRFVPRDVAGSAVEATISPAAILLHKLFAEPSVGIVNNKNELLADLRTRWLDKL